MEQDILVEEQALGIYRSRILVDEHYVLYPIRKVGYPEVEAQDIQLDIHDMLLQIHVKLICCIKTESWPVSCWCAVGLPSVSPLGCRCRRLLLMFPL